MQSMILDGDLNEEVMNIYLNSPTIAVDTETMGLKPHRDRLCMVQICNAKADAHMIRVTGREAPNLKKVLEKADVKTVFHYARFDVMYLKHYLDIEVQNIYCTKIASKLGRTYTQKHGLKDVVLDLLGLELDKSSQSSNWAGELSQKQINYALNDVRYLIPLMEKLDQLIEQENRGELLQQCLSVIPVIANLELQGWSESIFSHH